MSALAQRVQAMTCDRPHLRVPAGDAGDANFEQVNLVWVLELGPFVFERAAYLAAIAPLEWRRRQLAETVTDPLHPPESPGSGGRARAGA